jgi:hypothetical protein
MDVGATVERLKNPHGSWESETLTPPVAPVAPTGIGDGATGANCRPPLSAQERAALQDKVARERLARRDAQACERDTKIFVDEQLDLGTASLGELRERFGA